MQVVAAIETFAEETGITGRQHQLHHVRGTVEDRRVHDRPLPGLACVQHTGQQADSQIKRTTADVAE
ncbi:hypothetical protein D3C85_1866280 [compost metagenome]